MILFGKRWILISLKASKDFIYTDERQKGTLFTGVMGIFLCCS